MSGRTRHFPSSEITKRIKTGDDNIHYTYRTQGTCSSQIDFEINNGVISDVVFTNGCNGNLKAIGKLVDGWTADDIAGKLLGNTCGFRSTSCADQLAKAVLEAKEAES